MGAFMGTAGLQGKLRRTLYFEGAYFIYMVLEALSGALLVTADLEQAVLLAERFAAEHQQLMGDEAEALAPRCLNAAAVFVGNTTPTCFGDYAAGPSHVLPTGGSARYSSGLSVINFVRRSHLVKADRDAATQLAATAATLARVEGLSGHARSADLRAEGGAE